jgi:hypothetical protein
LPLLTGDPAIFASVATQRLTKRAIDALAARARTYIVYDDNLMAVVTLINAIAVRSNF